MKKTVGKRRFGFYLLMIAAILSLASMVLYNTVLNRLGIVYGLSVITVVIAVLAFAGEEVLGANELLNWMAPVNSVITALTAIICCSVMLDAFGYVVSGLYQFSQIQSYVIYAVVVVIAMVLNVAAGFTGIVEES